MEKACAVTEGIAALAGCGRLETAPKCVEDHAASVMEVSYVQILNAFARATR